MAASTAWRGAVEFAGFPVNVKLSNRVKSRSGESFKTLAPDGKPVRSIYIDSNDEPVDRANTSKGIEIGKDDWKPLTQEAVDSIAAAEKDSIVTPRTFAPVDTVPLELAVTAYSVVPDDKVPGAEKSVNTLWNGLRESGLAYTTEVVLKAGSRDAILVLYARSDGLYAVTLPYAVELHQPESFDWQRDDAQAEAFTRFVEGEYQQREFDHSEYESGWRARRQAAIDAVLNGKKVKAQPKAKAEAATPDLMSALEASVESAKPATKRPAKKAAKKSKVAA